MSANYYSQTPNFVSASSEDVDPRTRLFSFQHSLGQIIGNSAMGPELTFSISYSATSGTDYYDLGIGIAPALTLFDYTNGQLSLASGESYTVDASVNPPIVRQNKMRNFDFIRISNPDGSDGFRVIENDGSVTDLTEYDSGIYVTTRIYTALGYSLNINWDFTSWGWGIDSIVDDSGVTHLIFDHDAGPALTFYPGSSEEYTITLQKSNGYLSAISHSGLPEGQWQYFYDDVGMGDGLLTLTKTQAITGLIKSVIYNSGTTNGLMLFPDQSGEGSLPAVTELVIDPGFDQPQMITTYTPDTLQGFPNYLGYDAPQGGQWDASTDYVYSLAGQDYFYSTTLTQTDSDGQEITTTYTYNNYHLLSKLEVLQGDTHYTSETYYYADAWQADHPDTSYDDLPAQYQYPLTQTLTWTDSSGTRSELTQYQYDDFGNLTQQIDPDGIQTDYEYYSADGEADSADDYTGCPADPNGFANLVKSKKVTPAPSEYVDVPIRATYYRYGSLDALDDRPMTTSLVKVKESSVKLTDSGKQSLTTLDTKYYSDDKKSFKYGHISAKNTTIYNTGSTGSTSYLTSQAHDYTLTDMNLESTVVITSFDNFSLTGVMARSCYSGKLVSLTNFNGTPHTYYYTSSGHFDHMYAHEGDAQYERTARADYMMETDNYGNVTKLSTTITNYNGNASRLNYDSFGRVISIEKNIAELTGTDFSTILTRKYDSVGRILFEEVTDSYINDAGKVLSATVNIKTRYDDWGRSCAHELFSDSDNPDGSVYLTRAMQFSSVGHTISKKFQSASGKIESNSIVMLNNQAVPESITQYDSKGNIYSTTQSYYDGLKRLRKLIDQLDHPTLYEYDDFDRVYKSTYADGTVVTKTFAPQFTHEMVTTITVTDVDGTSYLLGSREVDGLGRVNNSTVGGRYESYTYVGSKLDPDSFTDSLSRVFTYTYEPMLENALSNITAIDKENETQQGYTYFKNSGFLDTVTENCQLTNSYTWYNSGSVETETIANNLGSKQPLYTWSVLNKPVSYTDMSGKAQWLDYYLSGKDACKPWTISDPAVTITFGYDEFGRLLTQTAQSVSESTCLTTQIEYDDYSREQTRTIIPDSGESIIITTEYFENNQVSRVKIEQGTETLSDNHYYYDSRNRLHCHECSGSSLPKDGYGQEFVSQTFEYDCLNNIKTCTTLSSSDVKDIATFIYENSSDPTQLTSIGHQGNPAYPSVINLYYYDDGQLHYDEAGRVLTYDASGRLFSIEATDGAQSSYGYDGLHNLVFQSINGEEQYLYYRGAQLVNQVRQSEQQQDRIISGLSGTAAVSHEQL
ncbi:hypothetical protein [Enterobacter sp. C2]|uniref:hypothetical protein n=1 Tax=Enterobacter sp. C2 TaxID=2870346 RepID=UPI001CA3F5A0|nr:hypothetical protein [Enterobacter sp. C2]